MGGGDVSKGALRDADEILVGGFEAGVCQALGLVHHVQVSVMPRKSPDAGPVDGASTSWPTSLP